MVRVFKWYQMVQVYAIAATRHSPSMLEGQPHADEVPVTDHLQIDL